MLGSCLTLRNWRKQEILGVVVRIEVDRNGKVISATPGVRGTTNNDHCLLEPARKTAFMHRWNLDSKALDRQVGFVVVNFKLGQ